MLYKHRDSKSSMPEQFGKQIAASLPLCKEEGMQRFACQIVQASKTLSPDVYIAFTALDHWKVEFERYIQDDSEQLLALFDKMKKVLLLDRFTAQVGQDWLIALNR